jgi:dolichol kinase
MRHAFHAATGLVLAFLIFRMGKETGLILIGALFLFTILMEILRLQVAGVNKVLVSLVGPMLKDTEISHPTGVGYFLGGILLCLLLFGREVTLASIAILSVGDPTAAVIGRRWGRVRIGEKSLEGTIGFFAGAMAAGMVFQGFWPGISMVTFSMGALIGAVVELLPLNIDDNLLLPLAAGLAMEVSIRVFG